jgi:hypothetical protein
MKIHLTLLKLFHPDRWTDISNIIGAFFKLFIANAPETPLIFLDFHLLVFINDVLLG